MTGERADYCATCGAPDPAPERLVLAIIVLGTGRQRDSGANATTYQRADSRPYRGALSPIPIGWHRASRDRHQPD